MNKNRLHENSVIAITQADYVNQYNIKLSFSDGLERVINFEPFLNKAMNPMTTQFKDLKKFKQFHLDNGDLLWGDYEMCFPIWDLYIGEI